MILQLLWNVRLIGFQYIFENIKKRPTKTFLKHPRASNVLKTFEKNSCVLTISLDILRYFKLFFFNVQETILCVLNYFTANRVPFTRYFHCDACYNTIQRTFVSQIYLFLISCIKLFPLHRFNSVFVLLSFAYGM